MKKITAIVLIVMLVGALAATAVMALSPERTITVVPTKDDLPDPTDPDSPFFIYVDDEGTTYVKFELPDIGIVYIPEDEVPGNIDYSIVKGAGETVEQLSTGGFVIASDADENGKLVAIIIDGKIIDESCYIISPDSADITLTPEFIATLAEGEHTFTIQYTDGSASATFFIHKAADTQKPSDDKPPQTGDDSKTSMWTAIALIALGSIGVVALTLVKTRKSTDK